MASLSHAVPASTPYAVMNCALQAKSLFCKYNSLRAGLVIGILQVGINRQVVLVYPLAVLERATEEVGAARIGRESDQRAIAKVGVSG